MAAGQICEYRRDKGNYTEMLTQMASFYPTIANLDRKLGDKIRKAITVPIHEWVHFDLLPCNAEQILVRYHTKCVLCSPICLPYLHQQ